MNEFSEIQGLYPDHACHGINLTSKISFEEQVSIALNKGRSPFSLLTIGIDPGETVGVAAEADGMLLFADECLPPFRETLVTTVRYLLAGFQSWETIIRVGLSPEYQSTNLLRLLLPFLRSDVRIELVDEKKTSKGSSRSNSDAAIQIARRSGRVIGVAEAIRQIENYVIPEGRVHEIQKWSRRLSSSRTLSSVLAREVAEGNLTLEQALALADKENQKKSTIHKEELH